MSFVDLPAHVALTILRRLDARDLCALRATCRAFDAALVEAAAFEATRARAPWLAKSSRHRENAGPSERRAGAGSGPASAKREDESWLDLLRFAELAAAARLPRVVAAEDVTAVVDREGRVHVWGPVVDAQGYEQDDPDAPPDDGVRGDEAEYARTETAAVAVEGTRPRVEKRKKRAPRCVVAAAGYACSFGAGGARGGLRAFRNVAGVDASPGNHTRSRASRPPAGARDPARAGAGGGGRSLDAEPLSTRSDFFVTNSRAPRARRSAIPARPAPTNTVFSRLSSVGATVPAALPRLANPKLAIGKSRAIGGPPRIVSVAVGRTHALAAAADGSLWSWGNDVAGQLGLGGARVSATLAQFGNAFRSMSIERHSSSPKTLRDRARQMRRDRDGAGGGGSPRAASPGHFSDGHASACVDEAKFFPPAGPGFDPGGSRRDARSSPIRRHGDVSRDTESRDTDASPASPETNAVEMRRVERFSDDSKSFSRGGGHSKSADSRRRFVVAVAASRHGSACVTADGALFCWGSNRRGALGLGDDLDRDVPTRVRVRARDLDDGSSDDGSDDGSSRGSSRGSSSSDDASRGSGAPLRSPASARRVASPSARMFPGALSDTDSDSDAERARDARGDATGKAPVSPSGPRARTRTTSPSGRTARAKREKRRDAVVTAFSYGARHAAAVTSRGELFCWGDNRQGQCGRAGGARGPDAVLWPTRTELPPGSSDEDAEDDDDGFDDERLDEDERLVKSRFFGRANAHTNGTLVRTRSSRFRGAFATDVAAGATHTLALDASGRVWSFGAGHGLAPGDPADGYDETMYCPREGHSRRPPERARGIPRAVAVAAGARHSAVVVAERRKRNGEENDASENDASENDASEKDASSSERVGASGAATRRLHVYTWGANDANQLGPGFGDRAPARPTPTRVATFRTSYVVRT